MTRRDVVALIEQLLELDGPGLRGDEEFSSFPQWDSMAIMGFIASIQKELGIVLDGQAIVNAKRVNDLVALVADKLKG